jgi:hypothetical protein
MKSTSSNNSEFFIELIPLDHSSSLDVDSLSQSVEIPLFDFNATGPLPVLDTSLASPDTALTPAASETSSIDDGAVLISSSETMEIDDDISICSCPSCQAPVSIRNWLMVADCWACGTSIKIGLAVQSETISPFPVPAGDHGPKSSVVANYLRAYEGNEPAREPRPKETIPALVISMIFMIVLLTLLGILMFPEDSERMITLSLTESRFVREGGVVVETDPHDELNQDVPVPDGVDLNDPEQRNQVRQDIQEAKKLREDFDVKNPNLPDIKEVKKNISDTKNYRSTLKARDPRVRVAIVKKEGGTTRTEAAVARGLHWIAQHQNANGSWSFDHRGGACQGRCGNPGNLAAATKGATAMALLPFLGAGQTHKDGKYKKNVLAGLEFLLGHANETGHFMEPGGRMYSHGLCAITLCEAFALTQDKGLRGPAQKAIDFIVYAQDEKGGGWRYSPKEAGDTSVMGWQVMALQSARAAGLRVPAVTLNKANSYLDKAEWKKSGRYGYLPNTGPKPAMTAEGLLCRMYLRPNRNQNRLMQGVNHLARTRPPNKKKPDLYYLYYASQVFHHVGGKQWEDWNYYMRESLINSQVTNGHAYGSFQPGGSSHDKSGGRLYVTALSVCCLEVYYRHLPLFRQINLD